VRTYKYRKTPLPDGGGLTYSKRRGFAAPLWKHKKQGLISSFATTGGLSAAYIDKTAHVAGLRNSIYRPKRCMHEQGHSLGLMHIIDPREGSFLPPTIR